eukprot:766010-Hanusia_phi.AAC.5
MAESSTLAEIRAFVKEQNLQKQVKTSGAGRTKASGFLLYLDMHNRSLLPLSLSPCLLSLSPLFPPAPPSQGQQKAILRDVTSVWLNLARN